MGGLIALFHHCLLNPPQQTAQLIKVTPSCYLFQIIDHIALITWSYFEIKYRANQGSASPPCFPTIKLITKRTRGTNPCSSALR